MDENLDLDSLVSPLRDDVLSGAGEISHTAAEVLTWASRALPGGTAAELRTGLARVGVAVLEAQPAMASLVTLVGKVLDAVGHGPDVEAGREAALQAAEAFRVQVVQAPGRVAERAAVLLPEEGTVLTLSSSATVREALLANPNPGALSVVVLESRPLQEGRLLAAALADAGVPVTVAVDAAAAALAPECAAVLLGADSIGDAGVVNKLGSAAAAHAAHRADVPTLVMADVTKMLPPGFPQRTEDPRPPEEVWHAPAGVEVLNRYFEAIPLSVVTSVVTDVSTLTPAEVEEYRRGLGIPEEVRAWAARVR